ncbi:hypothetical protein [Lolliginicoccus suaedae]|uniref:hypothetical protein n=1 Tax=Lolliginicoccus suaedae TaxID=2605429 RepID=UPI0011ED876D|nr:hypothetical protein [Lolliginicoccus suaedae]
MAVLAVALAGAAVVGALNPVPPLPVATDALGPAAGEPLDEYRQRAAATLDPAGDEQPRWALVLPEQPVDAATAAAVVAGTRASRLVLDGGGNGALASDPAVSLPAPAPGSDDGAAFREGVARGISLLREQGGDLDAQMLDAQLPDSQPLGPGCACIIGVVVHAPLGALGGVAGRPGVASVEALPADSRWGAFAVRAR